jgi:hypothetical protein
MKHIITGLFVVGCSFAAADDQAVISLVEIVGSDPNGNLIVQSHGAVSADCIHNDEIIEMLEAQIQALRDMECERAMQEQTK